jgi:type II secretory pathway pseudopilin PulG
MRRLDTRGDTIVEVLIAILVISVILTGAFVSARRSQAGIRQSQERVEALKVSEAQLEHIRYMIKTGSSEPYDTSVASTYCFDLSNFRHNITAAIPALQSDAFASSVYPSPCHVTPSGLDFYTHIQVSTSTNTFTAVTRWDGYGGIGKQEVRLSVRMDP